MKKIIYLDNASTTKTYKEVAEIFKKTSLEEYGNASSPHLMGEIALKRLIESKKFIAKEINAKPEEIIFTSGATESNNLALFGLTELNSEKKKIIISSIEHSSVYEPCIFLKERGYEIIEIPVSKEGLIDMHILEKEIDEKTLLVSVIHGHNELGTIQDIERIAGICKSKKVFFHTDAVQSFGKTMIDVNWGIDMLSASAHKLGGPKGIGFLYVRNGVKIKPLIYGGSQERKIRAGTENVPGIVGFAKALEIAGKEKMYKKVEKIRNYFMKELEKMGGEINGSRTHRLCNNIHVSFSGEDAEQIVISLSEKGIMCSSRSACLTNQKKENRILKALGLTKEESRGSVRFTLSEFNTKQDINYTIKILKKILNVK